MVTGETILAALIGAGAVLLGGILTNLSSFFTGERARRRSVIAEAVQVAFDRVEIVDKIRRRPSDKGLLARDELDIRNEMHHIQSRTQYYITILSSESAWLGASYEKLVAKIKKETEPLMQAAWKEKPGGVRAELKNTKRPDVEIARRDFVKDTQRYFNPLKRVWFGLLFRLYKAINHE